MLKSSLPSWLWSLFHPLPLPHYLIYSIFFFICVLSILKLYFRQLKHRKKDYVGAGGWRIDCPVVQIECFPTMWKSLLCLGEIFPLYTRVIFPTLNLWGNESLEGWKVVAQNRLFEVYGGSHRNLKYRIAESRTHPVQHPSSLNMKIRYSEHIFLIY